MSLLQVGSQAPDKAVVWVICRQHPGEPMAEWFAEGLLERLTAAAPDGEVQQLLGSAVLYIVPNMCPDGSVRCAEHKHLHTVVAIVAYTVVCATECERGRGCVRSAREVCVRVVQNNRHMRVGV